MMRSHGSLANETVRMLSKEAGDRGWTVNLDTDHPCQTISPRTYQAKDADEKAQTAETRERR